MTLTEAIVTEFIEHYLHNIDDRDGSTRKRKRNGNYDHMRQAPKCSRHDKQQRKKILQSLNRIADEFDKFIGSSSEREERFAGLITPLIPLLIGNGQENEKQYSKAFEAIADELFSQDITWSRVVTFLVYNGELASKVTKESKSEDKISRMTSQIIDNICRYFDEKIMQWIDQQDGGWLNIVTYEHEIQLDTKNLPLTNGHFSNGNGRCIRQVISVAALAAVIGGLYMCSKLSVQ